MNAKRILGIIILLIGVFYAAVPHNLHVSSGLGIGLEHTMHIALGAVLIIIGLFVEFKMK